MKKYLTEPQIKKLITRELGQYTKRFWYMPGPSPFTSMDGQPDFIIIWKGIYIGIEVKGPKYKQSAAQKMFQKKLVAAGGIYLLITSYNVHKLSYYIKLLYWMVNKIHGLHNNKKGI